MAKTKVSQWDSVAANNTDINAININEGCPPSTINNAIREMMAQIKDWQDGSSGDNWTSTGILDITGSLKLDGDLGLAGQVIESRGSTDTPRWKSLGTMSLQNYTTVNITGGSITTTGTLDVTGALKLDSAVGTSGQVLVSSGSSATPTWGDAFVTGMIMLWSGSIGTIPSGWALCNGSSGTPDLRAKFVMGAGSGGVGGSVGATGGYTDATLVSHSHTLSGTAAASTISGTAAASSVSGSAVANGGHNHTASTSVATKTGLNGTLTLKNRDGHPGTGSLMAASTGSITRTMLTGSYGEGWKGDTGKQSSKATFALDHNHSATTTNVAVGNHTHTLSGTAAASSISGTAASSAISGTAVATGSSATNANLPPYYALAYIMKL